MGKSLNQAKQFYCATSYGEITASSTSGRIFAKASADGEDLILKYVDAKGEQTRSDIIKTCNVLWAKAKSAESEREYVKKWTITLNSSVNSGNVVSGANYIVNIGTKGYYDQSDVNVYTKHGVVHGYTGMTAAQFYAKLAISVAKNFSREVDKPVKVFIGSTEIKPSTKEEDITNATSVIIQEAEPYWKDNSFDFNRYRITVAANKIEFGGGLQNGLTITESKSDSVYFGNGKKTAELEQFCKSMSSDYYQHGITTPLSPEMMVNPTSEYNYLTIHHCFIDSNEGAQRSEKDIVVVSTEKSVINSIITALNTATGKSFATLTTGTSGTGSD